MATLISYTLLDNDGDRNTVPIFVQDGLTLAQYSEFAIDFGTLLDAVTASKIDAVNLTINVPLDGGWSSSPGATAENQMGGLFNFSTDGRFTHSIRIPGLTSASFNGKEVVVSGPTSTLVDAITDGLTVTGPVDILPQNGHDEDLVSLNTATKSHRRK
jgi:hypothetical protein